MTTVPEPAVTVRMSEGWPWLFRLGCPAVGLGLGFLVAPAVGWLLDVAGSAPGPLRVLAQLSTGWAVLVTTLLGVAAGLWLAQTARKESLSVTVTRSHIDPSQAGDDHYLPGDRIGAVFRDGSDLVLLDTRTTELARQKASDLSWNRLREAFERFDYPWRGSTDPHDREFRRWVDGHPDLDTTAHDLLRARTRAIKDGKSGAAAETQDRLGATGIVVRDRGGTQEYRRIPGAPVLDRGESAQQMDRRSSTWAPRTLGTEQQRRAATLGTSRKRNPLR